MLKNAGSIRDLPVPSAQKDRCRIERFAENSSLPSSPFYVLHSLRDLREMSLKNCDSCEVTTVNVLSGVFVLLGLQQVFCPSLCWKLGYWPENTPTHPQWALTLQAFGAALVGWGLTLYDKNLTPHALMFYGGATLGCIIKDGKTFSLPYIFSISHFLAGAWLFQNKK